MSSLGIGDQFGQSGKSHEELLEHYGLTSRQIVAAARQLLAESACASRSSRLRARATNDQSSESNERATADANEAMGRNGG